LGQRALTPGTPRAVCARTQCRDPPKPPTPGRRLSTASELLGPGGTAPVWPLAQLPVHHAPTLELTPTPTPRLPRPMIACRSSKGGGRGQRRGGQRRLVGGGGRQAWGQRRRRQGRRCHQEAAVSKGHAGCGGGQRRAGDRHRRAGCSQRPQRRSLRRHWPAVAQHPVPPLHPREGVCGRQCVVQVPGPFQGACSGKKSLPNMCGVAPTQAA
jgi:hypothetical protein